MQAITFPESISAETIHRTILDTAWQLLDNRELNVASFVEMIALNAPNNGGAELFNAAISRSLTNESVRLARALADQGVEQYPDDEQLHRFQRGIAPPRILETGKRAGYDFSKSMRWLSAHSRDYVGQWLALRDGELLAMETTRQALVEKLGEIAEDKSILITRIPNT